MSKPLQLRAKEFLARPIPPEISYVPGSIAERILAVYAQKGTLDSDADLSELLEICVMETADAMNSHKEDASVYFTECNAILEGIQTELS